MTAGLSSRVGRPSQLRTGADGGGLENEIRVGLVQDADTILPPTIENVLQILELDLVADADSILLPSIAQNVAPDALADADALLSPSLALNILLNLVVDADTVPQPTVASGGDDVHPNAFNDADTVASPTVAPGAVTVAPDVVVDSDTLPAPTVQNDTGQSLVLNTVNDADTLAQPSLGLNLEPAAFNDADTVEQPVVELNIAPDAVADVDTLPSPSLDMNLAPNAISDADTIASPSLAMNLAPSAVADADTIPQPTLRIPVVVLDAMQVQTLTSSSAGSRTVSAGDNRVLFLIQWFSASTDATPTATYGGQTMTLEATISNGSGFLGGVKIFSLNEAGIAAASGTSFSVTSPPTGGRVRYGSISFENVDQTDISVDSGTGGETSGDIDAVDLTTVDSGYAFAAATVNAVGTATWAADLTELLDIQSQNGGGTPGGISLHAAGAATDGTTATADPTTTSSTTQQAQAAISLRAA